MSAVLPGYHSIATVAQLESVNIASLFKPPSDDGSGSPIDTFIIRTNTLNRFYAAYVVDPTDWIPELGNLILLGYMSAIESYVRTLITGLVNVDTLSRRQAGFKLITFAVATNHPNPRLLPEVLMENMAFSSAGVIEKALKDILGLAKISDDLKLTLVEFEKLCQVRHCCVHRFGKLGSQNAMELGFERYKGVIEYPFTPSPGDIDGISDVLQGTVRTLKNFIFREVLDRTWDFEFQAIRPWVWTWHYGRDRKRFQVYYDLFALTAVKPSSPDIRAVYDSFRNQHRAGVCARRSRNS